MTLNEYQVAAFRTCPDLGEPYQVIFLKVGETIAYNTLSMKLNLSHMVHGMCSELSELSDAQQSGDQVNMVEELCDIMWYVAGYCTFRNYELDVVTASCTGTMKSLAWHIHELTDIVKKFEAYNKPINDVSEIHHLGSIVVWIKEVIGEQKFNVGIKNNIDKLRARYPDKFTEEAALNRNLDAERKELEK